MKQVPLTTRVRTSNPTGDADKAKAAAGRTGKSDEGLPKQPPPPEPASEAAAIESVLATADKLGMDAKEQYYKAGQMLIAKKKEVGRGNWENWLATHMAHRSPDVLRRYMRVVTLCESNPTLKSVFDGAKHITDAMIALRIVTQPSPGDNDLEPEEEPAENEPRQTAQAESGDSGCGRRSRSISKGSAHDQRPVFPDTPGVQDAIKGLTVLNMNKDSTDKNLWAAIDQLGENATADELVNAALRNGKATPPAKDIAEHDSVERGIQLADQLVAILLKHPLEVRFVPHVVPIVTWRENLQSFLKDPVNQVVEAQKDQAGLNANEGKENEPTVNVAPMPAAPDKQVEEAGARFECNSCGETFDDDSEAVALYECGDCGTTFTRETSANDNHQCPDCNKFGSKISDMGCSSCNEGELETLEEGRKQAA